MSELNNPRGVRQVAGPRPEREWLTYAEAGEIVQSVVRPRHPYRHEAGRTAGAQMAGRGPGEAVASVRRTLTRSGGKVAFGEPKTKKSRRSIRLTPQAVEALREHLKRQLRDIEILGDRYQDQGLVFTTDTGAPINPSNLRQRSFAPLLKRAGLPHMRFHNLRHTCATLLLSRGVHPKFVQELLGHATITITLDTHSHVMPSMGDATAKAMEDALA